MGLGEITAWYQSLPQYAQVGIPVAGVGAVAFIALHKGGQLGTQVVGPFGTSSGSGATGPVPVTATPTPDNPNPQPPITSPVNDPTTPTYPGGNQPPGQINNPNPGQGYNPPLPVGAPASWAPLSANSAPYGTVPHFDYTGSWPPPAGTPAPSGYSYTYHTDRYGNTYTAPTSLQGAAALATNYPGSTPQAYVDSRTGEVIADPEHLAPGQMMTVIQYNQPTYTPSGRPASGFGGLGSGIGGSGLFGGGSLFGNARAYPPHVEQGQTPGEGPGGSFRFVNN